MIFQNPRASLDPSFAIRSQLVEVIRRHHPDLSRTEATRPARRTHIRHPHRHPRLCFHTDRRRLQHWFDCSIGILVTEDCAKRVVHEVCFGV